MKVVKPLVILVVALFLTGCATTDEYAGPWEYKYVRCSNTKVAANYNAVKLPDTNPQNDREAKAIKIASDLSREGWVLVSVTAIAAGGLPDTNKGEDLLLVFKRPKK